jgi:hypothetical protein
MIVGFDVGFGALPASGPAGDCGGQCGMATDSTRVLCIPPEEGYGGTARPGIPANSTLLIEIKCIQILAPPPRLKCDPHAKPVERCPGGLACPPSGLCPAPAPPPPIPPPPPPPQPPPPAPPGKCAGGLAARDCDAWIDLYDRTGGANWTHCSGNRRSPCSCLCPVETCAGAMNPIFTDHGDPPVRVTCGYVDKNLTASITELTLGQNNLVGSIPASIGNLSAKLTTLGIFYNPGLAGSSLPPSIGQLAGLKEAYFYANGHTGEIPASIGNATALRVLLLAENHLTGTIPASFTNLTKVAWLELQHNRLTGTVPVLNWASTKGMGQCSLDAAGAGPRGQGPSITGRCIEPNCNKFACPLPAGSDQCVWGSGAGVHCSRKGSSESIGGGYGGLGRHVLIPDS